MNCVSVVVCNRWTTESGVINADGISNLLSATGPKKVCRFGLVVFIHSAHYDTGPHNVRIRVIDGDGNHVLNLLHADVSVRVPDLNITLEQPVGFDVEVELRRFGLHAIEVYLDGELSTSCLVEVREQPERVDPVRGISLPPQDWE
jgi:hypothetical protein